MKNKRFLKITLIAAIVALLCAALCGCSLIQGLLHPEGKFALSESEITLKIGETYDVTLSDGRTDEFTLSTSDKTKVEIYGRTSIKAVGKTETAVTITATNGKGDTAELKEAADKINSMDSPLALYIFSSDKKNISFVKNCIQFGGGCINDTLIHLATSEMGFGGVGESGMGAYHGRAGFDAFSHKKSIVDKKTIIDLPMRYQPYTKLYEKMVRVFLR